MALSGSYYTNVGSHWRLQLEWSATQNIANNQSNVTAKLYWIALDGYGAIYSSQTNPCSVYIDGTWSEGSASPALSGNQKKLVRQYSRIITHASDGKATIDLDGWFDIQVTLGGTYYGRVNLPTKSYTLDTIPRASSLTSSASWTAGNDLAVSISRASSSFVHSVYVDVNGVRIGYKPNIGTSTTFDFTTAENTEIFNQLNTASEQDTKITVVTYAYAGGSEIGRKEYTGIVTAPFSSDVGDGFDPYVYTDESVVVPINRRHTGFTHTVTISLGSFSKTLTNVGTSATFSLTTTEENTLNSQMPNETYKNGTVTITTYYNGEQVRSSYSRWIQFHVRNAEPIFPSTSLTFKDTNATTVAITGNDQNLIQGQSTLTVYIGAGVQAQKGASITRYIIYVDGKEQILTTLTGNKVIGTISSSSNQSLSVRAVDSRGFETTVLKTVTVIPWEEPKLILKLDRVNKFEDTTTINVSGTFSPVTIGTPKNLIQLVRYRYKVKGSSTWTLDWTNLTHTTNGSTFSVAGFNRTLDNTKSWEFEFSVQDKFTTNVDPITVGTGSPIVFIDSTKKSVGIGKFPNKSGSLELLGNEITTSNGNQHVSTIFDFTGYYSTAQYFKICDLPVSSGGSHDLLVIDMWGGGWVAGENYRYEITLSFRGGINTSFRKFTQSNPQYARTNIVIIGNSVYLKCFDYTKGYIEAKLIGVDGVPKSCQIGGGSTTVPSGTLQWDSQTVTPTGIFEVDYLKLSSGTILSGNDNFQISNGIGYMNGNPVFHKDQSKVIWSGGSFMTSAQTIYPSVPISQCPNGWVLIWSDYNAGEGSMNFDWGFTFIPKEVVARYPGTLYYQAVPNYMNATTAETTVKALYCANDRITGAGNNDVDSGTNNNADVVLRMVCVW